MEDQEEWAQIADFPDYQVSTQGRVARIGADRPMSVSYTQHGHAKLNLTDCDRERHTRSVALLVARAFVIPEYAHCDHVIVKNMDYSDLRPENLAWRPDGFAWEFAHQFKTQQPIHMYNLAVHDTVHGVTYPSIIDAAVDQGLLLKDIWRSTYSGEECFPTRSIFVVVQ